MPGVTPFLAVAVVLIVVPGADMALVTKNTISKGKRAGLQTVAGVIAGVLVHGTAAVVGLSALIAASSVAFRVVKIFGAFYLILLGAQALLRALRGHAEAASVASSTSRSGSPPFVEGLLTNVLNPKLVVFFVSLMPQFINAQLPPIPQIVLLSLLYAVVGSIWLVTYVLIVDRLKRLLERPLLRRVLDSLTGAVLVALGLRLVAAPS